jgi:LmbE family N-acetylglucosaminyl deacetylase
VRTEIVSPGMSWISRQSFDAAIGPAKAPLAMLLGRALCAASTDVSASVGRRSCLVLAQHPDDETLGCAVSILRRVEAGSPVHVAVVTDGGKWPPDRDGATNAATRRAELAEAAGVLGLRPSAIEHMGFADQGLAGANEDLTDAIVDLVRRVDPEEVLATDVHDPHVDHAVLAAATRRALSGTRVRLLAYPIHQWNRPGALLRTARGCGRPETVRTQGFLEAKRRAIAAFPSQLAPTDGSGDPSAGLTPRFLTSFTGAREIFFPVETGVATAVEV